MWEMDGRLRTATVPPVIRWHLLTIGKPRLAYARAGVEEYLGRLGKFTSVRWLPQKSGDPARESQCLLEASKGMLRLVLDERGTLWSSRDLARRVSDWELSGRRDVALLIGGADGHTPELRAAADSLWSLSPLTLQHELALVVVAEQLYRAYTLKAGLPYHRD